MTTAEATAASLTIAQRAALKAVKAGSFNTATELGAAPAALAALAAKGLVERRIPRTLSSSPRSRVEHEFGAAVYRITGRGVVVLRKVR